MYTAIAIIYTLTIIIWIYSALADNTICEGYESSANQTPESEVRSTQLLEDLESDFIAGRLSEDEFKELKSDLKST